MKLSYCFIVAMHLLVGQLCLAQEINWSSSKNWKLYNIHNKAGFNYPVDTLVHIKSINLNNDTMHAMLRNAVIWPKEKTSVWMGLYIATYEGEDNKIKKVIISSYGGFFYLQSSKRYYQIPAEQTAKWFEWLNDNSKKIDHE